MPSRPEPWLPLVEVGDNQHTPASVRAGRVPGLGWWAGRLGLQGIRKASGTARPRSPGGRPLALVALSPACAFLCAGSISGGPLPKGMAFYPMALGPQVSEGQQLRSLMCAWKLREGCDWPVWVLYPSWRSPINGQSVLLCHWPDLLTWLCGNSGKAVIGLFGS